MADVICDTSFLFILADRPVSNLSILESELGKINFIVPSVVVEELKKLAKSAGPKRAAAATSALELARAFRIVVIEGGSADDVIVEYAVKHRCYVATVDNDLRKKLKDNGIGVVTLSKDRITMA